MSFMANTDCLVCEGTGAVARDGGLDPCPMNCAGEREAVPVPVDEELTALVEDESMADLVGGWCANCAENGVEHIPEEWIDA